MLWLFKIETQLKLCLWYILGPVILVLFTPPLSEKKIVKGFFAFREGEGVRIYGTLVNWLIGLLVNWFVG